MTHKKFFKKFFKKFYTFVDCILWEDLRFLSFFEENVIPNIPDEYVIGFSSNSILNFISSDSDFLKKLKQII